MKRMMIIAAAFAALVSCSKSETSQNPSTEPGTEETTAAVEYAFTEGETVTITAGTSLTKVSSALNDKNGVDFKWQSGDKILVSVGDKSSEFTVSKLKDGGVNAEFTGTMPASGNDFDVQYPVTDPDLTSQTYSSTEAVPNDAMKFTAEDCTVEEPFKLTAVNAALRLNLWGTSQTVGKIVVTNTSSTADPKPSYTLNANSAVTIGTTRSDSTSFFIVVPVGEWKFKAEIYDGSSASICSFETSNAKTFEANQILNMSAKEVKKVVLLPGVFTVSAGKDGTAGKKVKFTGGNLWCDTKKNPVKWHVESSQTAYPASWSTNHVGHFFWTVDTVYSYASSYPYYGITRTTTDVPFFAESEIGLTVDGQSGLYALTKDEWSYLFGTSTERKDKYKSKVTVNGVTDCLVIAPDNYSGTLLSEYSETTTPKWSEAEESGLVCLPAAGYRNESSLHTVDRGGRYWSATPYADNAGTAYCLYFKDALVSRNNLDGRDIGSSVRLVSTVSE